MESEHRDEMELYEDDDRNGDEDGIGDEGMDEWLVLDDIEDENEENYQTTLCEERNPGTDAILQEYNAEDRQEFDSQDDDHHIHDDDGRKPLDIGKRSSRKRHLDDGRLVDKVDKPGEDTSKRFKDESQSSQEKACQEFPQDTAAICSGENKQEDCSRPIIFDDLIFEQNMCCPFCRNDDKKYVTRTNFIIHWIQKHSIYTRIYPCPILGCSETFKCRAPLIYHANHGHSEQQRCEVNFGDYFPEVSGSDVAQLKDDQETNFPLGVTGQPIPKLQSVMDEHIRTELASSEEKSEEKQHPSPSCGKDEKSDSEFQSSELRTDAQQDELEDVNNDEVKFVPNMKCPICQSTQQFPREIEFLDHWKMHHTVTTEKHFCHYLRKCGVKTNSARLLQEHFKSDHNDGKEIVTLEVSNFVIKKTSVVNERFNNPKNLVFNPSVTKEFHFHPSTKCPVCVVSAIHTVLDTFEFHWLRYHCKFGTNFYCSHSGCKYTAQRLVTVKKHYWENHNYGNDMLTMAAIETLNDCKKTIFFNHFFFHPTPYYFKEVDQYVAEFRAGMECPICPRKIRLKTLQQYHSHWQTVHLKYSEKFECPVKACASLHKMMDELRRHYVEEHNSCKYTLTENIFEQLNKASKKRQENPSFIDPRHCVFLSAKENADDYNYVDILSFRKGMVCPVCPKVFAIKSKHLQKHWQEFHILFPKTYVCPFKDCKEFRPAIPELKHHYRVAHNKGLPLEAITTKVLNKLQKEIIMNKDFIDPTFYRLSLTDDSDVAEKE